MNRSKWLLTREIQDCVPQSELRSRHEVTQQLNNLGEMVKISAKLVEKLVTAALKTNSWTKSQGILTRLLRTFCCPDCKERRSLIAVHPEPRDLELARRAKFLVSMQDTFSAIKQGKLVNIDTRMVFMTRRFREKDLVMLQGREASSNQGDY